MKTNQTIAAFIPAAALIAACSSAQPGTVGGSDDSREVAGSPAASPGPQAGTVRIHPIQRVSRVPSAGASIAALKTAAPAGAQLTYYGGPVLSNVSVVTVFWGSGVQYQKQLNSFYGAVTNSPYYDWLKEYSTPKQAIGRGKLLASVVDTGAPSSSSLDDSNIQSELASLIDAGSVPAPDANTLYMVHFPPGVDITQGGQGSCQVFCAYHGTFTHGGKNIYYGVIPDQGGNCAGGCGSAPDQLSNTESVSSHELVEATTDAAVGLAGNTLGPPIAWYDSTNGEIGDICNADQGTISVGGATYTVQKEWSNKNGACILSDPGNTCTPSCGGKQCGSDGCGGSCGSCASGQTCSSSGTCQGGSGGGGGSCAHDICTTGTKLKKACDTCVANVCAQDSYCCNTKWDATCVSEVADYCDASRACN